MRVLAGIAFVTVFALIAWSIGPSVGKTHRADSIKPLGLMNTTGNLPTEQYDVHFGLTRQNDGFA